MPASNIASSAPTRTRNGFVSFCLWFGTVSNALSAICFILLLGSDRGLFSGYPEPIEYRLGWIATSIVATAGGWLMIKWNKLGYYLAAGALICGGFITFGACDAPLAIVQSVLSAAILFGILQIKSNGVSCWNAMDGLDKSPLAPCMRYIPKTKGSAAPKAATLLDVAEIKDCKGMDGNTYKDFGTLMLSYIFPNPQVKMRIACNDCRTLTQSLQAPEGSSMPVFINGRQVEAGGPEIVSRIKMELVNAARNDASGNLTRLLINTSDIKTFWSPLFPINEGQFCAIVREVGRQFKGYACLT